MAPQTNPPDPNKVNPNEGEGASGQNNPPVPPIPPVPSAPPAPPAKDPDAGAPVVGDCDGVTKGLRKLVTEQYGKDFIILSIGRGKAYIENARIGLKIETTTGNPVG